jgi:hypothetical protein
MKCQVADCAFPGKNVDTGCASEQWPREHLGIDQQYACVRCVGLRVSCKNASMMRQVRWPRSALKYYVNIDVCQCWVLQRPRKYVNTSC